jgi:hypothetical protein
MKTSRLSCRVGAGSKVALRVREEIAKQEYNEICILFYPLDCLYIGSLMRIFMYFISVWFRKLRVNRYEPKLNFPDSI